MKREFSSREGNAGSGSPLPRVPGSWAEVPLSGLAEIRLGRQRSPDNHTGPFMRPYLRAANVTWSGLDLADVNQMNFPPGQFEDFRLLPGDILLSEASGSAAEVGKPALWRGEIEGCCFQNTLIRVRPRGADPRFLLLHFKADAELGRFSKAARGVGIHHLGAKTVEAWPVRVPPIKEQHRIVDEVEKQFTRLAAAVAALERVKANLKRYRASVLKAACEGRLVPTEAELARREGRSFESGEELLKRILKERRRLWEAGQTAKAAKTAGTGSRSARKATYKDPLIPPVDQALPLPAGWAVATWNQLGFSQNGRPFPSSEYCASGTRLIRPGNLHLSGRVEWNERNAACLPDKWADENADLLVGPGELIMNLTAQSLRDEFLGRICLTADGERALLNQRLARLTPVLIAPRFVLWWFKTPIFRRFVDRLNTGSLIQHMFTSQLDRCVVPLPPLAEQHRIVAEVERRLSVVDELEATVEKNLARCARLRQSILKMAFEGRLVPQDPNDEPASVLLERIRAGRETAVPDGGPSRRRAATQASRLRRRAR